MKTFFAVLVGAAIAAFPMASAVRSAPVLTQRAPLYVLVDTTWPAGFDVYRYSRVSGTELISTTLRAEGERQAAFAGLNRTIVVLDDPAQLPAGASWLRITWTDGSVVADYTAGPGTKSKYLGVVSGYSHAFHPDHRAMDKATRANLMPDARADALVRDQLQMYLYESFQRIAALETEKG